MKLRSFIPAVAILAALAVVAVAYHLAPLTRPPRMPPPPAAGHSLAEPADPAVNRLLVRSVARDLVAREVVAGRTTVPEAAAVFGWLDARLPRRRAERPGQLAARAGLPDLGGYTEAETLGARVVAWAVLVAHSVAARTPGCAERVRGEFLAARARGAFARLPAPPEDRCTRLLEKARTEARRLMSSRADARTAGMAQ